MEISISFISLLESSLPSNTRTHSDKVKHCISLIHSKSWPCVRMRVVHYIKGTIPQTLLSLTLHTGQERKQPHQLTKMLLILLASTLLHLSRGHSLEADLHVSEHGAEYNETIEFDPITKAVTYQVPQHNDIMASTTIIHKPTVCSARLF